MAELVYRVRRTVRLVNLVVGPSASFRSHRGVQKKLSVRVSWKESVIYFVAAAGAASFFLVVVLGLVSWEVC